MALTVNTNIASLTVQRNLTAATTGMNNAIERMTTGYKINSAADDAAGITVAAKMGAQISGIAVAESNGQMGISLLSTQEGTLDIVNSYLTRIRDLTEQAANGTYGTDSLKAIAIEVAQRMDEIDRMVSVTDFNGIFLLDGSRKEDVNLQIGLHETNNDIIKLDQGVFAEARCSKLFTGGQTSASAVVGTNGIYANDTSAREFLVDIDDAIANIAERRTKIGAYMNRINSAIEALSVQGQNLTEANSSIKDADIAVESSNYIKNQILQQSAASLLTTANQTPNIALNLL